ncbi:MAG: YdcF family protein, partial [Actinomycetota bacterium]|nr:YdcF family protein [Actinomycetota bacterium]MDA3035130.1 YdcF family protein [Actinomycetota bacterium]
MSVRSRTAVRVVVVVAALCLLYIGVTLAQTVRAGRVDDADGAVRVAVVLGAAQYDGRPSAQFASRLDHARDLVADARIDRVVLTGGARLGDRFTEAEAG